MAAIFIPRTMPLPSNCHFLPGRRAGDGRNWPRDKAMHVIAGSLRVARLSPFSDMIGDCCCCFAIYRDSVSADGFLSSFR